MGIPAFQQPAYRIRPHLLKDVLKDARLSATTPGSESPAAHIIYWFRRVIPLTKVPAESS
jgi:hypothetical protein